MFICQDTSGRYTVSMYWYRNEFHVVTKEIDGEGIINQIDAARYPRNLAESLMNSVLAGERRVEGLEFDDRTAYSIAGRIAEGLGPAGESSEVRISSRWN